MNDRIIRKKIAVSVKFKVVTGLIEQHLLGVLQVLPHGQFRGMGIFTNQRLEDLVVIVSPVIHRSRIDMIVQFFPVRVVNALSPHFFYNCGQRGILRRQGNLNVDLQIPL